MDQTRDPAPYLNHDASARRYEIRIGRDVVGFVEYRLAGDAVMFTRTEIAPGHEGRRYGQTLVRMALEDVRECEVHVIPMCPFVAEYIRRHRQYFALVPWSVRAKLKS